MIAFSATTETPTRLIRYGSSYLEIQVAMVLLSLGMAGLYAMSVVQTKQTAQLTNVLSPDEVPALNPVADLWARKLGAVADLDVKAAGKIENRPYVYFEQVVDNLDPKRVKFHQESSDPYGWISWNNYGSYLGNAHYHRSYGNVGSYMQFEVDGLPKGEYEVLTTYRRFYSLGAAIPYQIYDDKKQIATIAVNQRVECSEVSYGGRLWDRVAVVPIESGKIRVRLTDGPGGRYYILGDAILVRTARAFRLISVEQTADGGARAQLEAPGP